MFLNVILFIMIYVMIGCLMTILQNKWHKNRVENLRNEFDFPAAWKYENDGLIVIQSKILAYLMVAILFAVYPFSVIIIEIIQRKAYKKVKKEYTDRENYNKSVQKALEDWGRR